MEDAGRARDDARAASALADSAALAAQAAASEVPPDATTAAIEANAAAAAAAVGDAAADSARLFADAARAAKANAVAAVAAASLTPLPGPGTLDQLITFSLDEGDGKYIVVLQDPTLTPVFSNTVSFSNTQSQNDRRVIFDFLNGQSQGVNSATIDGAYRIQIIQDGAIPQTEDAVIRVVLSSNSDELQNGTWVFRFKFGVGSLPGQDVSLLSQGRVDSATGPAITAIDDHPAFQINLSSDP
jgi:hypothetical protein